MADMNMFVASLSQKHESENYPNAVDFQKHIPVYDGDQLRRLDASAKADVEAEWIKCWQQGAGVFVVRKLFDQMAVVDAATQVFYDLLHDQNKTQHDLADHFAASGANSRVWNCLEKMDRNLHRRSED